MKIIALPTLAALILGLVSFKSHNVNATAANLVDIKASESENLTVPTLSYNDTSITLAWHKSGNYNNIVNYNIYMNGKLIGNANNNTTSKAKPFIDNFYKDSSNSSAVKISNHTYTVTGLKPDTSYNFTVRAVDNKGNELKASNAVVQRTTKVPNVFDVTKFGAVGDGKTLDTKSIQAAIDACTPGGEVLLPSTKTFKSGALWLKSDIIFKVDGKLLGSENPQDYLNSNSTTKKSIKSNALINANGTGNEKTKNIKIIGNGVIDGNGWKQGTPEATTGFPNSLKSSLKTVEANGILAANQFKLAKSNGLSDTKAYSTRSNLISISHVDNVYYGDGLFFVNPSQQTIGSSNCNNVVINNALIKTFDCNNGDGIDFDSEGLTVLNSVFDTGDDDINFTAGKGADAEKNRKPVNNVWIFNNYFGRGHGAVVAGSNTAAWIKNILAEDNVLNGTGSGLRCKTAPNVGGGATNIIFRDSALKNITDGAGEPFIFTSDYSNASEVSTYKPALNLPQFKHIFVTNCSVNGSKNNAIFVCGLAGAYHDDIHFENVSFKDTKPAKISYMSNSTFKNVIFDSSIKNPWIVTNSKNLSFN
ncbi:glycoside hydrolase family 28 protein [Clostridium sp. P21]|uniref:Glycoside hydrolase family 28 protein n=2 Tax=Clostridium muellerianum TaxID=2716538 RepID=A0A7Y0EH48_9CLOT|nr:glycoside hydrolase family 28 protein [Clostridium muellerianum]